VIPLFDVVGNAASVAPEQIGATAVNVGVICVVITISIVLTAAQGSVGVNVYVVVPRVVVLITAGSMFRQIHCWMYQVMQVLRCFDTEVRSA
jgi:Flp pilus assembly pilin Flp